jgi:hypothetical protein
MMRGLENAVEDVLVQGLVLLSELDDATYCAIAEKPYGSSIGQHYRHVLEHFVSVANALLTGTIDYDHRERNREWETSVATATSATMSLLDVFRALTPEQLRGSCIVRYTVGYYGEPEIFDNSFAREVAYAVSHAVHHFAIIRFVAAAFNIVVPDEFGIAPSTLKHRGMVRQ